MGGSVFPAAIAQCPPAPHREESVHLFPLGGKCALISTGRKVCTYFHRLESVH